MAKGLAFFDIQRLESELRQSEYEVASELCGSLISSGYEPQTAVAMTYRAGYLHGLYVGRSLAKKSSQLMAESEGNHE